MKLWTPGAMPFTPVLTAVTTNPTLGSNPIQSGEYVLDDAMCHYWFAVIFGTGSSAGSGAYRISVPVPIDSISGLMFGMVRLNDNGVQSYAAFCAPATTTTMDMISVGTGGNVTHASPFAWGDVDSIRGFVQYRRLAQ